MDLTLDPSAIMSGIGTLAIGVIGYYARRADEARKAEATEQRKREQAITETLAQVVQDVRDVRSTMTARFDALQSAVDGHAKEIELGRDARGKLHGRIDSQAERLTRAETRLEMHAGGVR